SVPLLASFSNDGRTITIAPAPQRQPQTSLPTPEQQPASATAIPPPQGGTSPSATNASPPATYFAVVDASHGGEERGAALSDQLSEKDVTLDRKSTRLNSSHQIISYAV